MQIALPLTAAIIMLALLIMQHRRHRFFLDSKKLANATAMNQDLIQKFKELDETKRKVDALSIKAGFRL